MKNIAKLMTIVLAVAAMMACSRSNSNRETAVEAAAPSPTATPTPEPTPGPEEREANERAIAARDAHFNWLQIDEAQPGWEIQLKGSSFCALDKQIDYYDKVDSGIKASMLNGKPHPELGFDPATFEALYKAKKLQYLKARYRMAAGAAPLQDCAGEGEGGNGLSSRLAAAAALIDDLKSYEITPAEIGITAAQLRTVLFTAAKAIALEWKQNPANKDMASQIADLQSAIQEYDMSAQDLGLTEEEMAKLRQ